MTQAFDAVLNGWTEAAEPTAGVRHGPLSRSPPPDPYFLLGPGALWLIVFFVVPLYYMARLSLDTGVARDWLRVQLAAGRNYTRRALAVRHASSCARSSTPAWRPCSRC